MIQIPQKSFALCFVLKLVLQVCRATMHWKNSSEARARELCLSQHGSVMFSRASSVPGTQAELACVGSVFQPYWAAPGVPRGSSAPGISQAAPGLSRDIHLRETFRWQVLRARYQQCLLLSSGAGAAGSCRVAATAAQGSGLPHGPGDRKTIHEEIRHNPSMFWGSACAMAALFPVTRLTWRFRQWSCSAGGPFLKKKRKHKHLSAAGDLLEVCEEPVGLWLIPVCKMSRMEDVLARILL